MALRFCDSFGHYTSITDKYSGYYTNNGVNAAVSLTNGRFSLGGAYFYNGGVNGAYGGECYFQRYVSPAATTLFVGLAFRINGTSQSQRLVQIGDSGTGTIQCAVTMNSSGTISIDRNGTTLVTSASPVWKYGSWHYLEFKLVCASSGGTAEARLDGQVVATFTGNTQGSSSTNLSFVRFDMQYHPGDSTIDTAFSDLYICDDSGTTNNSYLGDVRVQCLLPNGVGSNATGTQVGGTGGQPYTAVKEAPTDGDTSYIANATVGNYDTFAMADLSYTNSNAQIKAVQATASSRKDDAGTRLVALVARPGTTNHDGSSQSVSGTYTFYSEEWDTNPDTSAAWQPSEVNATEFGVKVAG